MKTSMGPARSPMSGTRRGCCLVRRRAHPIGAWVPVCQASHLTSSGTTRRPLIVPCTDGKASCVRDDTNSSGFLSSDWSPSEPLGIHKSTGHVVVTGGMGALGSLVGAWLLAEAAPHTFSCITLLGRSARPSQPGIQSTLAHAQPQVFSFASNIGRYLDLVLMHPKYNLPLFQHGMYVNVTVLGSLFTSV